MGCDIHSFAERKRNGKWEKVEEGFIELSQFKKIGEKKKKETNHLIGEVIQCLLF